MSYAYDVMNRIFADVYAGQHPEIDELFRQLIEAMHSANHRTPSADGTFKGDGIDKDGGVSRAARALEEAFRGSLFHLQREQAKRPSMNLSWPMQFLFVADPEGPLVSAEGLRGTLLLAVRRPEQNPETYRVPGPSTGDTILDALVRAAVDDFKLTWRTP